MDGARFDDVIQALTASRRTLLSGVLAFATVGHGLLDAEAKRRKQKKRHVPAKPNAFGCLNVGAVCRTADQCCSGICEGKKGRRACRAHDAQGCRAGKHAGDCGGPNVACTTSLGAPGACGTTTGNAGYCFVSGMCRACQTDAECQAAFGGSFGPRAACLRCATYTETGGTACAGPAIVPA